MAAVWNALLTATASTVSRCSHPMEGSWSGHPTATARSHTKPTFLSRTGYPEQYVIPTVIVSEAASSYSWKDPPHPQLRAQFLFGRCHPFRLRFPDRQRLVHPRICNFQVPTTRGRIFAFQISALPIRQIHIGHGVIVVGTKPDGFVELADAILDHGPVLCPEFLAQILLLGIVCAHLLVRLDTE